jgi:hypothetical protein
LKLRPNQGRLPHLGILGFAEFGFGELALFVTALLLVIQFVHVGRGHGLAQFLLCEFAVIVVAFAFAVEFVGIGHCRAGQGHTAGGEY